MVMIGMKKKGYADIWPVIAGALLVLVVVIVLLVFYDRSVNKAEAGFSACGTTGGTCVNIGACEGSTAPYTCNPEDGVERECCLGAKKALA